MRLLTFHRRTRKTVKFKTVFSQLQHPIVAPFLYSKSMPPATSPAAGQRAFPFDRTMAARGNNDGDWIAFDSPGAFKSDSPRDRLRAKYSRKKKKDRNRAESSRSGDSASSASWANRSVNADASWIPVSPPAEADRRESRSDSREALDNSRRQTRNMERRDSVDSSRVTEPVPMGSPRRRYVMKDQTPPTTPRGQRTRSRSERRLDAAAAAAAAASSNSDTSSPSAGARASSRGRSTERKAATRARASSATRRDPAGRDPSGNTMSARGRSSHTRTDAPATSSSRRHIVSPAPSLRSRVESPAPSPRRRLGSRSRSRSRSVSRPRAPSKTPSTARGRKKPPATTVGRRGRSTSRTPGTRQRSVSRSSRTSQRSASRSSRTSQRQVLSASASGVPQRLPPRPPGLRDDASARTTDDANIGRNITFGTTGPISSGSSVRSEPPVRRSSRREGGILEKLFGDRVNEEARSRLNKSNHNRSTREIGALSLPERIHPRILLTATVYHNTATNLWIATINTNQKGVATNPVTASKYLKAFSFPTEKEARESAIANAPPKMIPFSQSPKCFLCDCKFAVFRRACHCRNCGVCICSSCATNWSSKMIPETYNLKHEGNVRVCKSCDTLSGLFKQALLNGDYEEAIAMYGTGNINLRAPFPVAKGDKKGEVRYVEVSLLRRSLSFLTVTHDLLRYPVHCAVEGGNLQLLRWLVEEHYCPIKKISNGNNKKKRGTDVPITTSKGRSALSIAMHSLNVDMLRYLVVDRKTPIFEVKDLNTSLRALEAVLLTVPASRSHGILHNGEIAVPRWDDGSYDDDASDYSSLGDDPAFVHAADSSTIASRRSEAINDAVS